VVAVLGYAWKGIPGAIWAFIGGGIGVVATLAQVLVALGSAAGKKPNEVVRAFYRGSAVKFGVTVLLFVLALRGRKVVAAPMFSAYVATFLVYWVVLARSLTPHVERND
jgi:F0F1-type ATP synthase assembly protein I